MHQIRRNLLAVIMVLLVASVPEGAVAQAPTPTSPVALSLSFVPAQLPADGNTYPAVVVSLTDTSGTPTVALTNMTVLLTSSQESVGRVTPSASFSVGDSFATANFTTTNTPGTTAITASSLGLQAVTSKISTVTATGYPTHLSISAVPDTVIARPQSIGTLIVELVDELGLPAKAISDTQVSLFSSNTKLVNVTEGVVIKTGEFIQLINYTSGFIPGSAVVTGSAPGLDSGAASITVLGLTPLALKLYPQPSTAVTCAARVSSCSGRLVIALTDTAGNPTRAARDIVVQIRSSNLTILTPPSSAIIRAGNISAIVLYRVGSLPGRATVTVSSPGLQSGIVPITTVRPVGRPSSLRIYVGPNPVLADHRSYSSVVLSLLNSTGAPTVNFTGPTRVTLTSSVTGVGNFSSITLLVPQGQNSQATAFTSTFLVGSTNLTASAQNLFSSLSSLRTFGPVPTKVVLKTISKILPADGASHPAIEVILQDSSGSPAVAPFDVPVNVTSSQPGIARASAATIGRGQSFAIANVRTGALAGTTNITSIVSSLAQGTDVSSAVLGTVIPAPSRLAVYLPSSSEVMPPDRKPTILAIQLQDAGGNPARARLPMNVTITSSNATVIGHLVTAPIKVGQNYALVKLLPNAPGTTSLTVSAEGFTSAASRLTMMGYPIDEVLSPTSSSLLANGSVTLAVGVMLAGTPLKGVNVLWRSTGGSLSRTGSTTDSHGNAAVTFRPMAPGEYDVTAVVRDGLSIPKNFTAIVTAYLSPPKQTPSIAQELLAFPLNAAIAGAGLVAAAAAVLVLRRRRRRGEGAADEVGLGF